MLETSTGAACPRRDGLRLRIPPAIEKAMKMPRNEDVLAVQSRLQELFDTMPPGQADVLDAVVAGTPLEVRQDAPDGATEADEASIIIVSGRGGRWLVFDLRDVLAELNPQPLPPDPPDTRPNV